MKMDRDRQGVIFAGDSVGARGGKEGESGRKSLNTNDRKKGKEIHQQEGSTLLPYGT